MLPTKATEIVSALGLIPHPEGGFFLETYRSGVEPMSTRGVTQTDNVDPCHHVTRSSEPSTQRHALTSIYWVPTTSSPILMLAKNQSAHVHYFQGGKPFEYITYDPATSILQRQVLGPDLAAGHKLQVIVEGNVLKCGRVLRDYQGIPQDYTIIGEAVAPGFDVADFHFIEKKEVEKIANSEARMTLLPFLRKEDRDASDFDSFYTTDEVQVRRIEERSA